MNSLIALVFVLLLATPAWAQSRPATAEPRPAPKMDPRSVLRAMEDAFSAVADRVTPAVVHVSTVPKKTPAGASEEAPERFKEFFGEEFYERYFRRRPREDARATGSGVLVDSKGYILTNNHVIENAQDIIVRLSDQRKFSARLVGLDPDQPGPRRDAAAHRARPRGAGLARYRHPGPDRSACRELRCEGGGRGPGGRSDEGEPRGRRRPQGGRRRGGAGRRADQGGARPPAPDRRRQAWPDDEAHRDP